MSSWPKVRVGTRALAKHAVVDHGGTLVSTLVYAAGSATYRHKVIVEDRCGKAISMQVDARIRGPKHALMFDATSPNYSESRKPFVSPETIDTHTVDKNGTRQSSEVIVLDVAVDYADGQHTAQGTLQVQIR